MSIVSGPKIVEDQLVLYLDAGNQKSYPNAGVTWFDLSGNNYNGTLTNGASYSNGYITVDNIDDTIAMPNAAATNIVSGTAGQRKITVDTFVYFSSGAASWQGIMGYSFCRYMSRRTTDNRILTMLTSNGANTWPTSQAIPSNQFLHLVLVVEEDLSATYYLNGSVNSITTYTNLRVFNYNTLQIGSTIDLNHRLGGQFGSIRIYKKALTQQEIKQNFEATRGRYGI
jgi:hypothetical protein